MQSRPPDIESYYTLHSGQTDPNLSRYTAPLPAVYLPHETWVHKCLRAIGAFLTALVRKINQLLGLALAVLLLLLFVRFALSFFGLKTSLFAHWIFEASGPLVAPFENFLPSIPYSGYTIDVSLLVAIVSYILAVTIVRQFLKTLVARPY